MPQLPHMGPSPGEINPVWTSSSPCNLEEAQCCREQAHCRETLGAKRRYTRIHGHPFSRALQATCHTTASHLPAQQPPGLRLCLSPWPCTAYRPSEDIAVKDMYLPLEQCSEKGAELEGGWSQSVRENQRQGGVPTHSSLQCHSLASPQKVRKTHSLQCSH